MKRSILFPTLLSALILLSVFSAGCARKAAERAEPEPSEATPLSTAPQRIVSLSPSTTEILFSLGLQDRVVGVTSYCDYPPEAAQIRKVGDAVTSIETVISLKPDLVVGHSFVNAQALDSLRAQRLHVLGVNPKTLRDIARSVENIAAACGVADRGKKLASEMLKDIQSIRNLITPAASRPVLLFVVQTDPLYVAGPRTFVDEMINLCGGINAGRSLETEFNIMSDEAAIEAAPDFILVTHPSSLEFFKSAPAWKTVRAVTHNRVVLVDGDLFTRPTLRTVKGLKQMASIIGALDQTSPLGSEETTGQ